MIRVIRAQRIGGSAAPLCASPARTDAKFKLRNPSELIMGGSAAFASSFPAERPSRLAFCFFAAAILFLSSCAAPDRDHHIVISTRDQRLALVEKGIVIGT